MKKNFEDINKEGEKGICKTYVLNINHNHHIEGAKEKNLSDMNELHYEGCDTNQHNQHSILKATELRRFFF